MQDEKVGAAGTGRRRIEKTGKGDKPSIRPSRLIRIGSVPVATSSAPVLIPTRGEGLRVSSRGSPPTRIPGKRHAGSYARDNTLIELSVASLLATTIIPKSKHRSFSRRELACRGRSSYLQVMNEIGPDESRNASSSCSPRSWGLLQDSSKEFEPDMWSFESDSSMAALDSTRSMSNDSMPSLMSDFDMSSSVSSLRTPGIPAPVRARREKSLSCLHAENCELDHPLSPGYNNVPNFGSPHPSDIETLIPDVAMPIVSSKPSFISNLTASIRVLKTAAKSFSNFTAQHQVTTGRPMLADSLKFTDDRRPFHLNEVPDFATRRYLNPVIASAGEMHIHHDHDQRRNQCTTSIQLQTYYKKGPSSKHATSPAIFAACESGPLDVGSPPVQKPPSSRQREPRENSNFLRVIVLEMNMRKAGKMEEAAPGKARIWLPPRQSARHEQPELSSIPRRWSGIVV
ncbi:MAG: hypothetical protein Q9187_000927 [Circinaria calcarea]